MTSTPSRATSRRTTASRRSSERILGKLAERLSDPVRSGVYRVESTQALEEAAALNRYPLDRLAVNGGIAAAIQTATGEGSGVLLLSGFEKLFRERPWEAEALIVGLDAAVQLRRRAGACYFVAFLDPAGAVPGLAPLYNWQRQRSA